MAGRRLAWSLAAVGLVELVAVTSGAWAAAGAAAADIVASYTLTNTAFGIGFGGCGLVIAVHRPRNRIGWLFLGGALAHLTTAASAVWGLYGVAAGWPLPLLRLLATVFLLAWPLGIGLAFPLALLLFPTGTTLTPRWRLAVAAVVANGMLFTLQMGTEPSDTAPGVRSYAALPFYDALAGLWSVLTVLALLPAVLIVAGMVLRYRRGDETVRRQLLWLLLAVIIGFAANGQRLTTGDGPILLLLAFELVPVAITIAIVRHQLFDIRLVVSRTVAYLLLTAAVVGVYLGLVVLLDAVVRRQIGANQIGFASIVATVAVAALFNPVRLRLQGLVDRHLYGDRRDPVRAISQVGQRLLQTDGTDHGPTLDAVRQALRLPYAALTVDGAVLAAAGTAGAALHHVPLQLGGDELGELVVGLRAGETRLAAADAGVLDLMAVPLTMAVRAAMLAEEVTDSRGRIVAGREEERRRLRRDLHDGLGPTLTGIAYKLDATRNTLAADPARAEQLLRELRTTTGQAIEDVRRVVHGLRPPSLDELGLVGALRQHAARLALRPDGSPLTITVTAPAALPELPAAIEVAAYRIAMEGITNAARHSPATTADVRLTVSDHTLHITITDNATESATDQAPWRPGVGMTVMVERSAEVGGSCTAGPTPAGGRVTACLPLGA